MNRTCRRGKMPWSRLLLSLVIAWSIYSPAFASPVSQSSADAASVDPQRAAAHADADVQRLMQVFHVPGVAIGIVANGKVILAKGYGVREVGKAAPVDADTLFDIGSLTKSFTTTAMAMAVDDGKLDWDKPVRDYLPWFRMYDPVATELVTPRDLATHRTGLPSHDFIRFSTYLTREELIRRIRYLEPNHTFRDAWQYSNLMYTVAGYLAGYVEGTTWENLVEQRVFLPLGMTHSDTSIAELQKTDDLAHPHDAENGKGEIVPYPGSAKAVEVPFYDYQRFGMGPNGAVNSSVNDMLKYLAFQLGDGKVGNRQVVSTAQMKEMHRPVIVVPPDEVSPPRQSDVSYALGWFSSSYHGHRMLEHSGEITGFTSYVILLPEEKIGIVVLNNLDGPLPYIVAQTLLDRTLGLQPADYVNQIKTLNLDYEAKDQVQKAKFEAERIQNTKTTLGLDAYAGDYFHPAYGTIHVVREGDHLVVKFDALNITLRHYHYDTFESEEFGTSLVQFQLGATGKVRELMLPLEPTVKPFVFLKR